MSDVHAWHCSTEHGCKYGDADCTVASGDEVSVSESAGPGMSLRDWFAGQALAGLCANPGGPYQANSKYAWGLTNCTVRQVAHEAVALADAMLDARNNGGGDGEG